VKDAVRRWIIRDASGRISGPHTTEKVLYKIGRGEFSGEESIASYPNGRWISISQDPEFYDKLLEVIEKESEQPQEGYTRVLDFTRGQDDPTQVPEVKSEQLSQPGSSENIELEDDWQMGRPEKTATTSETTGKAKASKKRKKKNQTKSRDEEISDIELVDVRSQVLSEVLKRAKWPLLVGVAGVFLFLTFITKPPEYEQRIRLIGIQKNIPQVAPEVLKARISAGGAEFIKDNLSSYLRAQNDFVYVVERNTKKKDILALLCLTYLQLWPYAHQDSQDTKAIASAVQLSSAIDPGGIHSATCRAVDLIIRVRHPEAKNLVESVLESRVSEGEVPTIFYYLKGFLLEASGEHFSAISSLQTVQQLWPAWILPIAVEAEARSKMENYADAANLYRKILNLNPGHSVARIQLGILEYKYFSRLDQGEIQLKQGLEGEQAPRVVLSKGYLGLAEIALSRGRQSAALEYAKKAFALNGSNTQAKNLIGQIGGVSVVKNIKVKGQQLLHEGDQYFREGDFHSAQAHYKAAFEDDPKNAIAALKAAQCLWRMSFSTEAIEWLNRAIKSDPKLMESYVTLADYHAQRFNFLAASRILESARTVNPNSHEVFRGYALVELKRNNSKGALAFGKKALQLYENDLETLIIMAQAALTARDPKMAYNYAAKAIEIDVNHRQAQIVFAQSLVGLQGAEAGIDYLIKLVTSYPLVSDYRLALGKMLASEERYSQAKEIFRQVINMEKKPKEAYVELARVLTFEGENAQALDLLLQAAVLDPADAEPLYLAGSIYLDLKKPQEASLQFQRVLTINKLYPLVYYQLGKAALLMNNPKAALEYTLEERKANPNLADTYLLAAEAQTLMQQYSMCANEYQKAIKLRPQQASIYVRLAQCYRKAGNLDAASAMLNVAATKESGLAEIYKEQGVIFELRGDIIHAIEAYNQYFVLDPDAPDREQIEARISALQRGQRL
jgi:tetratricopeptide (TPR) repeat protein